MSDNITPAFKASHIKPRYVNKPKSFYNKYPKPNMINTRTK